MHTDLQVGVKAYKALKTIQKIIEGKDYQKHELLWKKHSYILWQLERHSINIEGREGRRDRGRREGRKERREVWKRKGGGREEGILEAHHWFQLLNTSDANHFFFSGFRVSIFWYWKLVFEWPSEKKRKEKTLTLSLAKKKEKRKGKWEGKGKKAGGRERERKKLEICLYFLRYPWKQMGTNRYFHYPPWLWKRRMWEFSAMHSHFTQFRR